MGVLLYGSHPAAGLSPATVGVIAIIPLPVPCGREEGSFHGLYASCHSSSHSSGFKSR
jgi:hypothetical protein